MKMENKAKLNNTKNNYLIIPILTSVTLVFLFFLFIFVPKVRLKEDGLLLDMNEKHRNQSLIITSPFIDLKNKFKEENNINYQKPGDYNITYTYRDKLWRYSIKQKVKIKDLTKPQIILEGGTNINYCPSKEYQELGFKAYDNLDGDITSKVKIKKSKDKIIYQVSDKAGNKTEVERIINYEDKTKPVITLMGESTLVIPLNSPYEEKGATAFDNCDEDISAAIEITSDVDTTKLGTYTVTYIAKDKAGNKEIATRTVKVLEPLQENTIYLTFDDGPRDGTTNIILDILKEKNIKATFFVTNNGPDDLIKRIVDEGHSIGIHTATHNYSYIYSSIDNYYADLKTVKDRIYNLTGVTTNLVRFPGGSSNTISAKYSPGIMSELTKKLIADGYQYYDWNIESGDSSFARDEEKLFNHVTNSLKHNKANVILMHDIKSYTANSLGRIIDYALSNGYSFDTITNDTMLIRQKVNN
ncbi:MAG TPA: polysaccharide deacetylase family protein [Candidatus Onthousia faecavium]|nr:polysaccharide deacetylase family protein [Candidatus Onthousia faecavium]